MASSAVKQRLAEDVGKWVTDGSISAETAQRLRQRWDQPSLGVAKIVKYLSVAGTGLILFGLLGVLAAASGSEGFAGSMLCGVGAAGLYGGVRFARDTTGRYESFSHPALTLGLVTLAFGLGLCLSAMGVKEDAAVIVTGVIALPAVFVIAYAYRNTYLLSLGLISAFHWIGSWTRMIGRSTYALSIEEPSVMCVAASIAIFIGVVAERRYQPGGARFHHAYQTLGLVYLNLSLLILTLELVSQLAAAFIALWAVVGIAQLVVGARLHSALFTSFGVTALALNLYTRYFELFWDELDGGLFMLLGGAVLFGAGFLFERKARAERA